MVCFTEKVVGKSWTDVTVGDCIANESGKSCGPGKQNQNRKCTDGTFDPCTILDNERKIPCNLTECTTIATTTGKVFLFRILYWETIY